ncbi:MAG: hypothetical protein AAFQ40_14510 [Cyanobacteria bacterium J06623_5]
MIAELPPSDIYGQKLCKTFSHRWLAIAGSTEDATDPKWETIGTDKNGQGKFPLRARTLWRMWQDPAQLVGVRFGNQTQYGLLDIDRGSKFHSAEGVNAISEALEVIGIVRTVTIRSSFSGGIHIYFPLPEAVPTFDLAAAVKYALEAQDIHIEAGQIEAFPNCKSFGRSWLSEFTQYNAHRLPLQPGSGSVLLDHDYRPQGSSLQMFFWRWEYAQNAQDMELLTEALRHGRDQHRKRPKIKAHPAQIWREDLEYSISHGFTGEGQTNGLLKDIACYGRVFEGLDGHELAEYVERIAVTRPGYLDHCNHQHEIDRRSRAWARAAERYYWPMGSEPKRTALVFDINTERAEDAIARIKSAVLQLATTGELPEGIRERVRKLCQTAHTSAQTLYKYAHLWHTDQWCVTAHGEGNAADSGNSTDPPPDPLKPAPRGLLHTNQKNMKCPPLESPLLEFCNPDSQEGKGGPGEREGFPQVQRY